MSRRVNGYDPVKRVLDLVASAVLIILTLPLQLVIGVIVAARLGRPVLFRQARPGRDEKIFTLVKFRSMTNLDPAAGRVTDEQRLTPFGAALRSTSLDELPTLINVLRGDMSFVGPRPLLPAYLERYSPEQARRHEVRPGITGLAQASGRNAIDWETKLRLDVDYVDSRSFSTDLKILWMTIRSVTRREGISADGHVTAHEFRGSAAEGRSL